MKKVIYNNGIGRRGRRPELIIFTPNQVWMGTQSIDGVASIIEMGYYKRGKWSSYDYEVTLADGVDCVVVIEDFNTGKFFPDTCMSWAAVSKELGLTGVSPKAVEAAVRENWPNHARRFDERREAIIQLEESGINTSTVEWECEYHTHKIGADVLLVDGELFKGESIPGKVIVLSKIENGRRGRYASTKYILQVADGVDLEYLTEGGFPGEDSLKKRGWTQKGGEWIPPQSSSELKEGEKEEGNIDLSDLDGLFS